MNKNSVKKTLSFILCMVLIAAMALLATGCSDKNPIETPKTSDSTGSVQTTGSTESTENSPEVTEKGEGNISFQFQVKDLSGNVTKFLIKTDKTTVGDALLELELIAGENGAYGLYVQAVNGITLDYAKDNAYWGFFVDGQYASKGVDATTIDPNAVYSFEATPA